MIDQGNKFSSLDGLLSYLVKTKYFFKKTNGIGVKKLVEYKTINVTN